MSVEDLSYSWHWVTLVPLLYSSLPVSSSITGNNNHFTQLFKGLKEITHKALVVVLAYSYY